MRIAEMEQHHDQYMALEARIRTMEVNHEFPRVFAVCEASFPHLVPALSFRKKRGIEPETPEFLSLLVICRYAPVLFEHEILESAAAFVKSTRVLAKHDSDYERMIQAALEREEAARVLWDCLEEQPGVLERDVHERLGIPRDRVLAVVERWEHLGIVVRAPKHDGLRLFLQSRLDAETEGVCPACGVRGKGRKELFFKPMPCRKCGAEGYYHIASTDLQS